ncbi:MAG TPA: aminoglycoside phosphotransferase family protein [Gemmataceae bacterium]|jgi:5-methylthioribose kinase|nr:aminoglycoside phosphotransferase family protein [Gemmataceae bacterium]
MLQLTADNALDYLRTRGWIGAGPARVEALGWGVSNIVLRIEAADRLFILKQSRPKLRTRDAWFSDLDRVYREQEVMEVLRPLLPEPTVPRVLFSDRDNYVFAMSHAPAGARVWKETLLSGETDPAVAEHAGRILGLIHETTGRDRALVERFRDHTVFVQLRVEPFYQRIQERRPEVAGAVQEVVDRMLSVTEALCHGDYSPKNILTHERGFTLVDYETAHLGDPTMDLGFFLSHLVLKAARHAAVRERYFDLTRAFWRGYAREMRFQPPAELEARGIAHFAICLLARIDGTSPVDYLPEETRRDAVRRTGRRVLLDRLVRWEQVLEACDAELTALE